MPPIFRKLMLFWIITILVACGSPTPVFLSPEEIISGTVDRLQALAGLHFVIDRSGAPAFLDVDRLLAFRRAEGNFVAPDRAQATIRVIGPGLVAEIEIISIGEIQWETNLLSGAWQELPPNWGFNPAVLFDPHQGIKPILEMDLSDIELLGLERLEEMPGRKFYALRGKVAGERLYQLSFGMIGPEVMSVQLWIDPETFDLHRMVVVDPQPGEAEPTTWRLDFWDFDQTVVILPPISIEGES
jgi:lipoprotein LprG